MTRCKDCYYWSYDALGDIEFETCLYWFFTRSDIYPSHEDDYPNDEYEDWDCKYFRDASEG